MSTLAFPPPRQTKTKLIAREYHHVIEADFRNSSSSGSGWTSREETRREQTSRTESIAPKTAGHLGQVKSPISAVKGTNPTSSRPAPACPSPAPEAEKVQRSKSITYCNSESQGTSQNFTEYPNLGAKAKVKGVSKTLTSRDDDNMTSQGYSPVNLSVCIKAIETRRTDSEADEIILDLSKKENDSNNNGTLESKVASENQTESKEEPTTSEKQGSLSKQCGPPNDTSALTPERQNDVQVAPTVSPSRDRKLEVPSKITALQSGPLDLSKASHPAGKRDVTNDVGNRTITSTDITDVIDLSAKPCESKIRDSKKIKINCSGNAWGNNDIGQSFGDIRMQFNGNSNFDLSRKLAIAPENIPEPATYSDSYEKPPNESRIRHRTDDVGMRNSYQRSDAPFRPTMEEYQSRPFMRHGTNDGSHDGNYDAATMMRSPQLSMQNAHYRKILPAPQNRAIGAKTADGAGWHPRIDIPKPMLRKRPNSTPTDVYINHSRAVDPALRTGPIRRRSAQSVMYSGPQVPPWTAISPDSWAYMEAKRSGIAAHRQSPIAAPLPPYRYSDLNSASLERSQACIELKLSKLHQLKREISNYRNALSPWQRRPTDEVMTPLAPRQSWPRNLPQTDPRLARGTPGDTPSTFQNRNPGPAAWHRVAPKKAGKRQARCDRCGLTPASFLCSRCKVNWYCGRDCQLKDWLHHSKRCILSSTDNPRSERRT